MKVEYSNIKELADSEKFALERVIESSINKIERLLQEKGKLKVHIKVSHKGERKRFLINYLLETPSKIFTTKSKDTEAAADFDITKAAHKEMDHLFNEIKHFTKKEEPNWKKYSLKRLFKKLGQ